MNDRLASLHNDFPPDDIESSCAIGYFRRGVNVSSLLAKRSFERAWHVAHSVSTCCAMVVKQYAFPICRPLAVQVLMEVKSGHVEECGGSASVPNKVLFYSVSYTANRR
jgi:hypothetical protein